MTFLDRTFQKQTLVALACGTALLISTAHSFAQSANDIMRQVRFQQTQQHQSVTGQLRSGPKKLVFQLDLDGPLVRYSFQNPLRVLQLRLSDKGATIEEVTKSGSSKKVSPARWDEGVYGTDLTFEDISLQFLYWPEAELKGEEKILSRPAWKIRLSAPNSQSQYSVVDLWIDKETGAFTKAEGYDKEGKLLRSFKLIQAQKINGTWFLKQMRIDKTGSPTKTYLEVDKAPSI